MEITSLQNQKIKNWIKLHQKKYRDSQKQFLVEGEHLIQEAQKADCLETLLIREGHENIFSMTSNVYVLHDHVMDKLSMNVSKVNYIGVCKQTNEEIKQTKRLLFLDNIQDPGNMGTIIRSAYSFGFDGILIGNDCVDVYNEKTIRSTQGALFHIPIQRVNLLESMELYKKHGVQMIATALEGAIPFHELKSEKSMGLILGNEGSGIKAEILDAADIKTKIEMTHFESLNVGVAASICMYGLRKGSK